MKEVQDAIAALRAKRDQMSNAIQVLEGMDIFADGAAGLPAVPSAPAKESSLDILMRHPGQRAPKRRRLSPRAIASIRDAQRARWAKWRARKESARRAGLAGAAKRRKQAAQKAGRVAA